MFTQSNIDISYEVSYHRMFNRRNGKRNIGQREKSATKNDRNAGSVTGRIACKVKYDTRCYFNVRSKADISQLNLPHKKGKVFPYSLPSVGPGADPGVQAVSPQVT